MSLGSVGGELHATVAITAIHLAVSGVEELQANECCEVGLHRRQRSTSTLARALGLLDDRERRSSEISLEQFSIGVAASA
jgi:hypothetical protein